MGYSPWGYSVGHDGVTEREHVRAWTDTHTHTHTHRNKISPALKKEQNAIVECSLLCEWPFSLSFFFFFSSWFFSPQFAPTPPPCLPKASLDFCLFLQPSCQFWKLPDNFFSSLLFYFH